MHNQDSLRELQDAIAYLKKATGQILTYQQYQRQEFEKRWQALDRQIDMLAQSAQSVSGSTNRLVSETSSGVKAQTKDSIAQGIGEEFARIHNEANAAIHALRSAAEAFARQAQLEAQERKKRVWAGLASLAVGALLAAVGGGAWLWYARAQVEQAGQVQMRAEMIGAFNAADVNRCDGRLCVNIDRKRKQTIGGKTYYLAQPRQAE